MEEFSADTPQEAAFTPGDIDRIDQIVRASTDPDGFIERASSRLPENLRVAYRELQNQLLSTSGDERELRLASLGFLFAHNAVQLCIPGYEPPTLHATFMKIQVRRSMVAYRKQGDEPIFFPDVEDLLRPYPGVYERLIRHRLADKASSFGAQVLLQCVSPSLSQE